MRAFAAAVALSLAATGVTAVGVLGAAGPASAAEITVPFTSAAKTVWTVPAGVTSIFATVTGAAGGGGGEVTLTADGPGGLGAMVSGSFAVTPGEALHIWGSTTGRPVGSWGANGAGGAGFSAGGAGGTGKGAAGGGGGGGGASAITRADGTALLVAAGGGGGGGHGAAATNCKGGAGGAAGTAGSNAGGGICTGAGGGGAAAASATAAGTPGNSPGFWSVATGGAGGGGGGHVKGGRGGFAGSDAGGAGSGGGGGGGSFVASEVLLPSAGLAGALGNGSVSLRYTPSYATTTTLTADVSDTVIGAPITFSASVASNDPLGGNPTGDVSLFDAANTLLGTESLTGGVATFAAQALPLGAQTLTAVFVPDTAAHVGSSGTVGVTVNQGTTTTTLDVSPSPAGLGVPVTATISVRPDSPAVGALDGTVELRTVDNTLLGSGALGAVNPDGSADVEFTFTPATIAELTLTASYAGNTDFTASGDVADLSVVKADSVLALSSSLPSSVFSQTVTFIATLSAGGGSTQLPEGQVTFSADGVALATVDTVQEQAEFSIDSLAVGARVITARFAATTTFNESSAGLDHPVALAATQTTVSPDVSAPQAGQPVVFTADVSVVEPGVATPEGVVTFLLDGVYIGEATTSAGSASITLPSATVGGHSITATFTDGTRFAESSSSLDFGVVQGATALALSSDANPTVFGQDGATVTAEISVQAPAAGVPSGTVDFSVDGVFVASQPVSAGTASLALGDRAVGDYTVTAVYSGDVEFSGSSAELVQSVQPAATALVLSADKAETTFGEELTLSAALSVVAPGGGVPTGTVTFFADDAEIGSAALNADGTGAGLAVDGTLTVGARSLTAVFTGDASFSGSTSVALPHTVILADVLVTLDVDASSLLGNPTEFVATVVPVDATAHVPSGFVQFAADGVPLGAPVLLADAGNAARSARSAEQSASMSTDTLTLGEHVITAQYLGDAGFAAVAGSAADHLVKPQAPINPVDPVDPLEPPLPPNTGSGSGSTAGSNTATTSNALASTGFDSTGAALAAFLLLLGGFGLFAARATRGRRRSA